MTAQIDTKSIIPAGNRFYLLLDSTAVGQTCAYSYVQRHKVAGKNLKRNTFPYELRSQCGNH